MVCAVGCALSTMCHLRLVEDETDDTAGQTRSPSDGSLRCVCVCTFRTQDSVSDRKLFASHRNRSVSFIFRSVGHRSSWNHCIVISGNFTCARRSYHAWSKRVLNGNRGSVCCLAGLCRTAPVCPCRPRHCSVCHCSSCKPGNLLDNFPAARPCIPC